MLWQLRAIGEEILGACVRFLRDKPAPVLTAAGLLGAVLLWLAIRVVSAMFSGGGEVNPYQFVWVSGRATYADGSPLPAGLMAVFVPQSTMSPTSGMRSGVAAVAAGTGEFSTRLRLMRAERSPYRLRVAILGRSLQPADPQVVPADCTDLANTPLLVETRGSGLEIRIPKPAGQ